GSAADGGGETLVGLTQRVSSRDEEAREAFEAVDGLRGAATELLERVAVRSRRLLGLEAARGQVLHQVRQLGELRVQVVLAGAQTSRRVSEVVVGDVQVGHDAPLMCPPKRG